MKRTLSTMIVLAGLMSVGQAADIVALCIGNDAYHKPEDVLDTPVADATLMKRTLEALPGGADVVLLTDASREETVIALNSLVSRSRGAKLVLVFYSGHGLEGQPEGFAKPDTFLLPVEASIPDVSYLPTRAVGLQTILTALGDCPVTARAVILDCCRTGAPKATAALAGSTKSFGDIDQSVKEALGAAVVPEATLVAFASGPLRKAAAFLKQSDTNSPFTLFIAESLATGTGNLRDLIESAAEKTEVATERRQVPQVTYTGAASAIRKIVFRTGPPAALPQAPVMPKANRKTVKQWGLSYQIPLDWELRYGPAHGTATFGPSDNEEISLTVDASPQVDSLSSAYDVSGSSSTFFKLKELPELSTSETTSAKSTLFQENTAEVSQGGTVLHQLIYDENSDELFAVLSFEVPTSLRTDTREMMESIQRSVVIDWNSNEEIPYRFRIEE